MASINLLKLAALRRDSVFEFSSKDMMPFKRHPQAISTRNLLRCSVIDLFMAGNQVGVEVSCGGPKLVAEATRQAVEELAISKGVELYLAIKASAFRRLS
jgi:molybdate transport system ATP-binding protein